MPTTKGQWVASGANVFHGSAGELGTAIKMLHAALADRGRTAAGAGGSSRVAAALPPPPPDCSQCPGNHQAKKCGSDSDCASCGNCTVCTSTGTFAGAVCLPPPPVYKCAAGGVCQEVPWGSGGVELEICQRACLHDGFACQDRQCVPHAGGVNKTACESICE